MNLAQEVVAVFCGILWVLAMAALLEQCSCAPYEEPVRSFAVELDGGPSACLEVRNPDGGRWNLCCCEASNRAGTNCLDHGAENLGWDCP